MGEEACIFELNGEECNCCVDTFHKSHTANLSCQTNCLNESSKPRYRSSHPEVLLRKGILKICSKVIGEHQLQSVISSDIALWHGCSPVNLMHIFRTPFPRNTSRWLLLQMNNITDAKIGLQRIKQEPPGKLTLDHLNINSI